MDSPSFDFDWEMGVFRGMRSLWRSVRGTPEGVAAHAAHLTPLLPRLTTLAGVLSGDALRIRPARQVGGLRGRDILLPEFFSLGPTVEDNQAFFVMRIALSATLWRERFDHERPDNLLDWLHMCDGLVQRTAKAWPHFLAIHDRVLAWERDTRPETSSLSGRARLEEEIRQAALEGHQPWKNRTFRDALSKKARKPRKPSAPLLVWGEPVLFEVAIPTTIEAAEETPGANPETEMDAHAFEDLRVLVLDEEDAKELPTHVFEKVETLENWDGGMRKMDAEDDLGDHAEALEEVELRDLIRGGEQAQSVYRADISMDISIPDVSRIKPDENGIPYDEWDYKKRKYRRDWTMVYPTRVTAGGTEWADARAAEHKKTIDALFGRLARYRDQLRPANRQLDGESIDLDALIEERASTAAGHGGNPRLHVRQDRHRRDAATTVLIDISLSTDSYVNDHRVIDVARDAVHVLGTVSDRLGDQLRVLAFASHTRNQVRIWEIKGWGEGWSLGARRLGLVEPQGYTRIGPALRHATKDLAKTSAKRRLLLLISDGKPTDFDKYEGRYGVADVRRAVLEAQKVGVSIHGLAVEARARDYLPAMLGHGAWHLLPRAEHLPELLTTIYGRLTSR